MPKLVTALVTDLDNTLWDWFEIWLTSFKAMLDETVRISGLDREALEAEIKTVHERYRTAEFALVLEELPSLQKRHTRAEIREVYASAIEARRTVRNEMCQLYSGVRETLDHAKAAGALIVGYTESTAFYTSARLRRTGLDDVIHVLYSVADHDFPEGVTPSDLRKHPPKHYEHRVTKHRHTPPRALKADPAVFLDILREVDVEPSDAVYVGDSLTKDVAMAQRAGVTDVWARYGLSHTKEEYAHLVRVTHWTDEEVAREKAVTKEHVEPSYVIDGFGDLTAHFEFANKGRHS